MNAELLVAGLWGVVVVYWLWTRRPGGDSIGSFRHELEVLEHATPVKVEAAHRLVPSGGVFDDLAAVVEQPVLSPTPAELRVAARDHRRAELRRRRRDVLCALAVLVLATLVAAAVGRSLALVGPQVGSDLVLGSYVTLLVVLRAQAGAPRPHLAPAPSPRMPSAPTPSARTRLAPAQLARAQLARSQLARAGARAVAATRVAPARMAPAVARARDLVGPEPQHVRPAQPAPAWGPAAGAEEGAQVERDIVLDGYRGAHSLGSPVLSRLWRPSFYSYLPSYEDEPEPYGDFGSYASLALAEAN